MAQDSKRRRVAIVGGGCAAMAAAWDLTSPDNPRKCEVTIFQIGGRLGGKGASSRNTDAGYRNRIEEHGLHLWLGYYENAFRMIRTCFKELQDTDPADVDPEIRKHLLERPFDNWNWLSAFERANLVGLADDSSGDWVPWVARFPEYVYRPPEDAKLTEEEKENLEDISRYFVHDSVLPGVHFVEDRARAYPGEEPRLATGKDCDGAEDGCLKRPNVAFFLTHALRELRAFLDSLGQRIDQLVVEEEAGSPSLDPDEFLRQAINAERPPDRPRIDPPVDVQQLLLGIRLVFLVPAIETFANIARILEGPIPYVKGRVVAMLDLFIDQMRERIERFVQRDIPARRLWELIDLLTANIRGIVAAGLEGADDFSSLDQWNYIDWLRMNRIAERTLNNPIIRGAHDLGFAYRDGDPRDPQIAAGQAITAGCRFFFMYKGALFWRMKAGMGDVVFAPMYLALRKRGVRFRFFHRLDEIVLDEASHAVTGLRFCRQVRLRNNDPSAPTNYEPLISVGGLPCWPRRPLAEQFNFDSETRTRYDDILEVDEQQVNFESIWCKWRPDEADREVICKVGDDPDCDFDDVIVTVPVAALGRVSQQVAESRFEGPHGKTVGERWKGMLDNLGTVATQSVQLWVNCTTRELGWTHGPVSFSAFVHPFETWADLSHLIDAEEPDDDGTRGVHYFCSTLREQQIPKPLRIAETPSRLSIDDPQYLAALTNIVAAQNVVRENARYFLTEWIYQLWPDATRRYPTAFKWKVLVAPEKLKGPERLEWQHVVANVDPSERYTLSLPGTTQYRFPPEEAVVPRLYVAGDWTDSGLNIGCVEAAVMSGRLASAGVTNYPNTKRIPGLCSRRDRVIEMQGGY